MGQPLSTKLELDYLYDHIVEGGVIIIDDHGHWAGARDAVDDFFQMRDIYPYLHRVDYTRRVYLKKNAPDS